MKEEKIGEMKFNVNGLRDLATAMENIYLDGVTIKMPIWRGDDGLYMQLDKGTGFIQLVKDRQEIGSIKSSSTFPEKEKRHNSSFIQDCSDCRKCEHLNYCKEPSNYRCKIFKERSPK